MNHGDMLLTLSEAACVLGCTDSVLRMWIKAGRLRVATQKGKARVRLAELRGLPAKKIFGDNDVEFVANSRMGKQSFVAA